MIKILILLLSFSFTCCMCLCTTCEPNKCIVGDITYLGHGGLYINEYSWTSAQIYASSDNGDFTYFVTDYINYLRFLNGLTMQMYLSLLMIAFSTRCVNTSGTMGSIPIFYVIKITIIVFLCYRSRITSYIKDAKSGKK